MDMENKDMNKECWNSQACLENSEWLAENVKRLDQSINGMLQLVEHAGDSSVVDADGDNSKQPELLACIREISDRHHLLADHYNKLAGEQKCYEKTSFDPLLTPPFHTPKTNLRLLNSDTETVASDLSPISGGGISDSTPNGGSESSLLSSDSDSESYNLSSSSLSKMKRLTDHSEQEQNSHDAKKGECGECEMLLRRISEYAKELEASTGKLQFAEEEIAKLRSDLQNDAAVMVNLESLEALLTAAKNQVKLHEDEIEQENKRSLMLHRQIVDLEAKLESEKMHIIELQAGAANYMAELSNRDLELQNLSSELQDASGNFALEKWQLETKVSELSESLQFHEMRTRELQAQCDSLTDAINKYEAEKIEVQEKHETLQINWESDIDHLKEKLFGKNVQVDTLNKTIDELKLRCDMLMAEKDGVDAKLQTANADVRSRDEQIKQLENNLQEMRCENKRLSAKNDSADKQIAELMSKIHELEKEVGLQATKTNDVAEEKREAIRQLCFSIDHFRAAYEEVRDAYVSRVHSTVTAS